MAVPTPAHPEPGAPAPDPRRRAVRIALAANAALLVVQFGGALAFGSLALLADTAHLVTDVVALGLALLALNLAARPPSARTTYGWERAEVLAAAANACLLVGASAWIVIEALNRFSEPHSVDGGAVAVIGGVGLVVNAGSAWMVGRAGGSNLNLRAAMLHLASDAVGSFGVVVAGIVVITTGAEWIDPVVSLAITALVLIATWGLLRDATSVLLEQVPRDLDTDEITAALGAVSTVEAVHHLHIWSLGSESRALSAHVVLAGEPTLHAAQLVGDELRALLEARFGIDHATLELECHDCADTDHQVRISGGHHH